MRISVDIPDELHAELKALGKREGKSMRAIILRGLEKELATVSSATKRLRFLFSSRPAQARW